MTLFTGDTQPATTVTLIEDVFEMGVYEDAGGGITDVVLAHRHTAVDPPDSILYNNVPGRLVSTDLTVEAIIHCPDCGMAGSIIAGAWQPTDLPVNPFAAPATNYNDFTGGTN